MNHVIFDSPIFYKNQYDFYYEGSSPKIIESLINVITAKKNKITTIAISFYLYNNPRLHVFFKDLIEETDIIITIISIPLEGYDNTNPKKLKYISNPGKETKEYTKYQVAKRIYEDIIKLNSPQYKLFIFPHMYIRSKYVKPFSRGQMPYSLHSKLFLIEYTDNETATVGITSSNLAARDLVKNENLLILGESKKIAQSTKTFFKDILINSIPIGEFDSTRNYFDYKIQLVNNKQGDNFIFIAPFYENSPKCSEDFLIDMIKSAKNNIYIVAQHISSYKYDYFDNGKKLSRKGFLWHALEKSKERIELRCLSQTYVDENGKSPDSRRPANIKGFKDFIKSYKENKNCRYAVNPSIHSKYIIIDNKLIITTCNFTPTQFIYIKDVKIDNFENIPELKYKGIHSEVGVYFVIDDEFIVEKYVDNMNMIWRDEKTVKM